MKIKPLNKYSGQTFPEVDGMIEITDEQYAGLQSGTHRFNDDLTAIEAIPQAELDAKKKVKEEAEAEKPKEFLRARRMSECFPIINRGKLWYDTLKEEQILELKDWYSAWLDVTETLIAPEKPNWIK